MYSCFKCTSAFSEFDKLKAHLKNSHDQDWPWICGFCDLVLFYDLEFEVHIKQHTDKPPFACPLCSRLFSDNSRLREHLARQHLPSEATSKEASSKNNETVSDKNNSLDLASSQAGDNLEEKQPQISSHTSGSKVKSKQQAEWQAQQIEAYKRLSKSMSVDKRPAPPSASSLASMPKDEAAVSRELAALLLNLHDSNGSARSHVSNKTSSTTVSSTDFNKAEDLSLKNTVETAIDLTKAKPEITLTPTMPASITKLVKGSNGSYSSSNSTTTSSGVTVTKTNVKAPSYPTSAASNIPASTANGYSAAAASAAAYPFYPSLASMASLSPTLAMNSNYLLQNLLLGKFQQIANSSSSNKDGSTTTAANNTSSTAASASNVSSSMALPTHPLPAQTLSLPASKPPASVLKTATSTNPAGNVSNGGNYNLQLLSESSTSTSSNPATASSVTMASNPSGSNGATGSSIDIPYMCRQIVTLLNGLLFHQHNLNNPSVELNVHTQLGAIYQRLQEVVVMVEQAKKQQEATVNLLKSSAAVSAAAGLSGKTDADSKTEEKIAKHIHEYQRALLKQHEDNNKEAVATSAAAVDYLKKQQQQQQQQSQVNGAGGSSGIEAVIQHQVDVVDSHGEESSSEANAAAAAAAAAAAVALKNRRRGRPPKNSNLDLSYSPPEKKLKSDLQPQPSHQQPESSSNHHSSSSSLKFNGAADGGHALAAAAAAGLGSSVGVPQTQTNKGGKGIRNRVFCGECTGCLKNDDCGKCRYCKDKTKFGGQNRLRQKCLHRRCQLDTHRRRSSQNNNSHHNNSSHHHHSNGNSNNNSFTDVSVGNNISRQSPSPDAIYSGVALARLASQQHKSLVIDTAAAVEAMASEAAKKHNGGSQLSPGEIIRSSGQPAFPQGKNFLVNTFSCTYFLAIIFHLLGIRLKPSPRLLKLVCKRREIIAQGSRLLSNSIPSSVFHCSVLPSLTLI